MRERRLQWLVLCVCLSGQDNYKLLHLLTPARYSACCLYIQMLGLKRVDFAKNARVKSYNNNRPPLWRRRATALGFSSSPGHAAHVQLSLST